jgi:hypothetical protein
VRAVLDPNHKLNLANRASGDCSANLTWTSIVFAPQGPAVVQGDGFTGEIASVIDVPRVTLSEVSPVREAAATAGMTLMISNSSHWPGAKGTNWRTDVEVHNPGSVQASYTFAMLVKDTDNTNAAKASFTLGPGLSQRYVDIIDSVFHFAGSAALQISVTSGSVLVTSDTYNRLAPGNPGNFADGSTFGQFVPALTSDQAITASDHPADA